MRAPYAWLFALVAAGCFTPDLGNGVVACGAGDVCPPRYFCHAADRHCYTTPDIMDMSMIGAGDMTGAMNDIAGADLASTDMACLKAPCGARNCGMIVDGCGSVESCGTACTAPAMCGAGNNGMPNVCGSGKTCTPKTCPSGSCGLLSDGCSAVLDCGMCTGGRTCGSDNFCH